MKITNEQFWQYVRAACDEAHLNAVGESRSGQMDSVQTVKDSARTKLQPDEMAVATQIEAILKSISED